MSKPLPKRKVAWKTVIPTEEQILAKREKAKRGWILVVYLDYPVELHKDHNGYPLTPPKKRKWRKNGCHVVKKRCRMSLG